MLFRVDWQFVIDVSGRPIWPHFQVVVFLLMFWDSLSSPSSSGSVFTNI